MVSEHTCRCATLAGRAPSSTLDAMDRHATAASCSAHCSPSCAHARSHSAHALIAPAATTAKLRWCNGSFKFKKLSIPVIR